MKKRVKPVLVIHGGAWAMPEDAVVAHERGMEAALKAGWEALTHGGSAVDAVEAAVTVMEDDDAFDAGRGSFLTRDGRVQMDALLMQGKDLRAGGVACVERLRNPIQAARLVMDQSPHVYFVGSGAERFATQHGMRLVDNTALIVPREKERLMRFQLAEAAGETDTTFSGALDKEAVGGGVLETHISKARCGAPASEGTDNEADKEATDAAIVAVNDAVNAALPVELPWSDPTLDSHDTVGAVAIDVDGNLAAGTSTGGTLSKAPGRVGDSSLIGCGCYADNESAAVSLTGWGEPMMKLVLGKWAVDRVGAGASAQDAATEAMAYLLRRLGGHGGIILMAPDGSVGLAHNTPRMAWGIAEEGGMQWGVEK